MNNNLNDIEKIFGIHACICVLNNKKRKIQKIWCTDEAFRKIKKFVSNKKKIEELKILNRSKLDQKLKTTIHQGIVVFCYKLELKNERKLMQSEKNILILDSLIDPQNVGSIIRSAYIFGINCIFYNEKNSFSVNEVLIKAASGAYEKIELIPVKNIVNLIKTLKKYNFWIIGLDKFGKNDITTIEKNLKKALILGSENRGIRNLIKRNCDFLVKIKMQNNDKFIDSLNVANAAAIFLYELNRK